MPTRRYPRRGSLQFWPRKRARKESARVRSWAAKEPKLAGFAGYKVGMTSVQFIDPRKTSPTSKLAISIPCTILECPPLKIFSLRLYKKDAYGLHLVSEILNPKLDKELRRKIKVPKKALAKFPEKVDEYDETRVNVYTQPKLTGIGKKKPEIFEMVIGGKKEEQFQYIKDNLDKEINIIDIIKPGQLVDTHAVTKGKGYQGPVKRFGVKIRPAKSEKKKRGVVIGKEGVAKVDYTTPMAGRMGYHLRTEYNKWIVRVSKEPDLDAVKKAIKNYGVVKNPYVLVKGSVAGPKKRLIKFVDAVRPNKKLEFQIPTLITI